MARDDVEPVRQRVWVRKRSSRTLDQRLNLRFAGIARISARLVAKLSPRSRIRQAALLRAVRLSFEAYNRRDLDAAVAGWDPDFEYFPDRDWVRAGLVEPSYRGVEGYRTYIATADEVWGGQIEPLEVIDTGKQFVVLGEIAGTMRGQARGVPLTQHYVGVVSLSDGIPVRCDEYFDRAKGLAAVGLDD